jgi:hypothetical protein
LLTIEEIEDEVKDLPEDAGRTELLQEASAVQDLPQKVEATQELSKRAIAARKGWETRRMMQAAAAAF